MENGLTDVFKERALVALSSFFKSANITVSGQTDNYPIAKTVIEGDFFKHYFEIGSEPEGVIEHVEVVDGNGITLWQKDYNINKDDNGWHIAIKFALKIEEVE